MRLRIGRSQNLGSNDRFDVFKVKGDSVLEKNIYAVMFGDYVSLYLAALREVDPCNVDPIVDIKARMRAVLPQ